MQPPFVILQQLGPETGAIGPVSTSNPRSSAGPLGALRHKINFHEVQG